MVQLPLSSGIGGSALSLCLAAGSLSELERPSHTSSILAGLWFSRDFQALLLPPSYFLNIALAHRHPSHWHNVNRGNFKLQGQLQGALGMTKMVHL